MTRMHPKYKDTMRKIGGTGQPRANPESHDAGSVKAWVHLLASHPGGQEPGIKERGWTVLMATVERRSRWGGLHLNPAKVAGKNESWLRAA